MFLESKSENHLMCPFHFNECHFWNLQEKSSREGSLKDEQLLMVIQRATLDSFWAREPEMVEGNAKDSRLLTDKLNSVGVHLGWVLPIMEPWAMEDTFGMAVAVATLLCSLDLGRNKQMVQFNTTRKI